MIPYYACDGPECDEKLHVTIVAPRELPQSWWVATKAGREWHFHAPSCVSRFFEENVVY